MDFNQQSATELHTELEPGGYSQDILIGERDVTGDPELTKEMNQRHM